jgi:hypothetical protein
VCMCEQGFSVCGGACIDIRTDVTHCGSCNIVCLVGQTCKGGHCGP